MDDKNEDILSRLHAPHMVAPVKASPSKTAFDNWPLCWGNSLQDGEDWYLVTDSVCASRVGMLDFPQDAKIDVHFVADLINAYRLGLLRPSPADKGALELRELTDAVGAMLTAINIHNELHEDAPARRNNIQGAVVTTLKKAYHKARIFLDHAATLKDLETGKGEGDGA